MEIRISDELNRIIGLSREEAMRTGNYGISPDHLFLGIIRHRDNAAAEILSGLGVNLDEMKQLIDQRLFTNEPIPYSEADSVSFSRSSHNVLSMTILEATTLMSGIATPEHLLLALCHNAGSGFGKTWLMDMGIDYKAIFTYMEKVGMLHRFGYDDQRQETGSGRRNIDPEKSNIGPEKRDTHDKGTENADKKNNRVMNGQEASLLEDFGYDITKAATEGRLETVVGRNEEIERVLQILGRKKKNNPLLVGDPGVGKTAIVEGLALKIASGTAPAPLLGKRIISLDIASVVAGTKYRGDFEKRLKTIIKEISGNNDIILFIDEFHTIVGAGGAGGSLDAANMLKPALARGEIRCIGATTLDEFTKIVEKDGALDRRFQKIIVEPADIKQTLEILSRIKQNYEDYHGVKYSDESLKSCVTLSERYITDRKLPDKAIDVMDEAGSMVKLTCSSGNRRRKSFTVTPEDIASVVSKMTGIPVAKMAESEMSKLLKMEDHLKSRVIGQDDAIKSIVNAIKRNRTGIKDPKRPIGTFLFLGPTGVGKTQLAKSIAEYLFGSEEDIIRIDMSEYMEKFTSSRLVGAPPGYVGYDDGGQLSEAVRQKPYSVVLLDEIEKAHPDIFNILLQVLDEGRLTDSNGRRVDFRNTIVVMTSNVGSREMSEYGNGLGFNISASRKAADRQAIAEKALHRIFPPEFLNRLDESIFFKPLDVKAIGQIVNIEIQKLKTRIENSGFKLKISSHAKNFIASAGFDPEYGARPLKRAIQKYIENPVAEILLDIASIKDVAGKSKNKNKSKTEMETKKTGMEMITINVNLSKDGNNTVVTYS